LLNSFFFADLWYEYDDDIVSKREDEDILKLCGGGEWHAAYLLFYKEIDSLGFDD
jgi:hypothetical protein